MPTRASARREAYEALLTLEDAVVKLHATLSELWNSVISEIDNEYGNTGIGNVEFKFNLQPLDAVVYERIFRCWKCLPADPGEAIRIKVKSVVLKPHHTTAFVEFEPPIETAHAGFDEIVASAPVEEIVYATMAYALFYDEDASMSACSLLEAVINAIQPVGKRLSEAVERVRRARDALLLLGGGKREVHG